ncbi:MAG: ABC transporter permease [Patescibacteria group bacterium]|nr:ABC transporter permease [Patescibacteria group bacterium]
MIRNFRAIFEYRELLFNLVYREISQRYKQSILGFFWIILNPTFQLLVLFLVFSTIFRLNTYQVPYPIFLVVGLLPWLFFVQSTTASANVLVTNASLITKTAFPREILVYATIIAKMVDFFFSLLIAIVFFVIFQIRPESQFFWVLGFFLIQLIFTAGLSLWLACLNLFYRDIQYLFSLLINLWFYLTPIIYPRDIFPESYQFIFDLNPMAAIIEGYRRAIFDSQPPDFKIFTSLMFFSAVFFTVALGYFKRMESEFADYV